MLCYKSTMYYLILFLLTYVSWIFVFCTCFFGGVWGQIWQDHLESVVTFLNENW
jgi:hypothetical protein